MAYVLSSVSGNLISAASAGFAPTNSADVSAIASAYQVVSATATQLYAGTAYVTSVNESPISASRAGNAANASLANSAWYDGTGRLISALPDSATVSAIASAYAESAASSKQDTLTFGYDGTSISSIDGSSLAGGGGGIDSATCSAIASAYAESAVSSKADSSALSSYVPYSSLEYNTASAISGINGSALAAGSTYSAGEGIDITDDVISVETPVDIVAGPGIVIDNPDGNTLRVSQYDPTIDVVRDCENWNGHTMKCIILRGGYVTNTTMQNISIDNVLPVGTTIAFIDGSNSYVVYGSNPQLNMMVPYCIDYNRLFSPWVDITNRKVILRYIDVSNNVSCTYYLCVKYAID